MSANLLGGLVIPDLAEKVVLIVGGSTGIGAALVRGFAAQRSKVILNYNASEDRALELSREIEQAAGTIALIRGDISVPSEMERIVREAAMKFGGLDGVINNAGGMLGRVPYGEVTDQHFDAVINLNAKPIVVSCRAAIPYLKKNGGFIINTSSIAARTGAGGGVGLYGSAKAFVSNVTRGLAKEVIGYGIRVNAVSPGVIATPFHERYSTPEQLRAAIPNIPQGRLGTPEDCVGAYLFLASNMLSGYMIGQIIEVNGGQFMP